jgi:aspartate/methionine/tyrosine aminotransferase
MEALKNTGLVFVPGSGFLQQENTHHFRTTTLILPEEKLHSKLKSLKDWHEKFMQKF